MKLKVHLKEKYRAHQSALCWSLVALPASGHAGTLLSVLNNAATILNGSIAKSVAVLALMGAGFMCFHEQKLPKQYLFAIVAGLGLIFGAGSLVTTLV